MTPNEIIAAGISGAALIISAITAFLTWRWRITDRRRADVTVYFQRNDVPAKVLLPSGEMRAAGYHLVLWNRGPAIANKINFRAFDTKGCELTLLDVSEEELPLERLDSSVRYPIPWALEDIKKQNERRFKCELSWRDRVGSHIVVVPLRRGQIHS